MFLGTAQFGGDYGITNEIGQPRAYDIYELLEFAWDNGVRGFDTAPIYGGDKLLGNFIRTNGLQKQARVLTKIPQLRVSNSYKEVIKRTVVHSLEIISCDQIEALFFHDPADSILFKRDSDFLSELQSQFPIKSYGVSIYTPNDLVFSNPRKFRLSVQFPHNVLDRRFEAVPMQAGSRYARSIFLQGLLVSDKELARSVPDYIRRFHKNYHNLLRKNSIPAIDFALAYANKRSIADYFILGFICANQFKEIVQFNDQSIFEESIMDPLRDTIDQNWLDPRTWS